MYPLHIFSSHCTHFTLIELVQNVHNVEVNVSLTHILFQTPQPFYTHSCVFSPSLHFLILLNQQGYLQTIAELQRKLNGNEVLPKQITNQVAENTQLATPPRATPPRATSHLPTPSLTTPQRVHRHETPPLATPPPATPPLATPQHVTPQLATHPTSSFVSASTRSPLSTTTPPRATPPMATPPPATPPSSNRVIMRSSDDEGSLLDATPDKTQEREKVQLPSSTSRAAELERYFRY